MILVVNVCVLVKNCAQLGKWWQDISLDKGLWVVMAVQWCAIANSLELIALHELSVYRELGRTPSKRHLVHWWHQYPAPAQRELNQKVEWYRLWSFLYCDEIWGFLVKNCIYKYHTGTGMEIVSPRFDVRMQQVLCKYSVDSIKRTVHLAFHGLFFFIYGMFNRDFLK